MKKVKKFLIFLIVLILAVCSLSVTSFAGNSEKTVDGITYKLYGTYYAVSDAIQYTYASETDKSTPVTIKSEIDGIPVTKIDEHAFSNSKETKYSNIVSLVIPSSVTSVPANAFKDCTSLESVKFETSVKTVKIKEGLFDGCENLKEVTLPTMMTDEIGQYFFRNCYNLTNIEIPEGVTELGAYAFLNLKQLKSISLPSTLTTINDGAIFNCPRLINITVNGGTSFKIINSALYSYDGKELISYPIGLSVDNKEYTVSSGTKRIGYGAFADSLLEKITLPYGLEEIGGYAFYTCEKLSEINIPETVKYIGTNKKGERFDESNAFMQCSSLKEITIPAGIINYRAAFVSSGLEKVTFADGTTEIQSNAFGYCYSLKEVYIPSSITSIEKGYFENLDNIVIYCEDSSYAKQFAAENGIEYEAHKVDPEIKNAKTATCTSKGYSGDTYCKACGNKISSGVEISALGHDFSKLISSSNATFFSNGSKVYQCTHEGCTETKTEITLSTFNRILAWFRNLFSF